MVEEGRDGPVAANAIRDTETAEGATRRLNLTVEAARDLECGPESFGSEGLWLRA